MSVEAARVGDVLELRRREVLIGPLEEYVLIGVFSFGKGIFHRDAKPGSELGDYRYFSIEPGDLVLSNIQAWEGAIACARDDDRGTVGTHRFLTYVPKESRVDVRWLRWYLLSEAGMALIRTAAPGTTARNRTLAIDRFENLRIPLPTIERQRRVAARLEGVAEASTRLTGLRNRASELREAAGNAMIAQACVGAPERAFGDLFKLERRTVDVDPTGDYREIGVRSFGRGTFAKEPRAGAEIGSKRVFRVRPGDLVISNVFAWEGAVAVAGDDSRDLIGSHRFMTWVPASEVITAQWASKFLASPSGIEGLRRASPGSAGRNRTLAISRLKDVHMAVPSLEDQRAVESLLWLLDETSTLAARATRVEGALVASALNEEFGSLRAPLSSVAR